MHQKVNSGISSTGTWSNIRGNQNYELNVVPKKSVPPSPSLQHKGSQGEVRDYLVRSGFRLCYIYRVPPSCFRVAQGGMSVSRICCLSRSLQLYCPNRRSLTYQWLSRVALSTENAQNDMCGFKRFCMHFGNGSWLITSPPTTTRG